MPEQAFYYDSNALRHHVTSNMIAASAGTGKTYQLASRYIALLVLGAKPEEIIALTFTRKAAGEFRNRILHALAEGACDKRDKLTHRNELTVRVWDALSGLSIDENGKAIKASNPVPLLPVTAALVQLAEEKLCYPEDLYTADHKELLDYYGFAIPNATTFARLLKEMVAVLSKLRLTTIDSFFASLVATNSMELGMNNAAPLDPIDEPRVQAATVRDYLDTQGSEAHSRKEFLRLFSSLTQGVGNKTQSQIDAELKSYLKLYRELPATTKWGDTSAFGDETQPDIATDAQLEEYQEVATTLRSLACSYEHLHPTIKKQLLELANGSLTLGKTAAKWFNDLHPDFPYLHELTALINAFDSQSPMTPELEQHAATTSVAPVLYGWNTSVSKGLEEIIKKLRDAKKWNLTANSKALKRAVQDLWAQQARGAILRTFKHCVSTLCALAVPCKLRRIADRTAALYSLLKGYADCYEQRMLAEGRLTFSDIARMAKALMLKDAGDPTLLRHHIAYRMGCELHHWMLDEFQDTSEDQFATLEPLLSPIAHDARANKYDFSSEEWTAKMPPSLRGKLEAAEHFVTNESLFVVGDIKQSIYGFRTGKTGVFDRLKTNDTWNKPLRPSELKLSFRSSPIIMGNDGFINRLFKALHSIECPENGQCSCIEQKPVTHLKDYAIHQAAKDKAGYVEIMAVAPTQNDDVADAEEATTKTRIYDTIVRTLLKLIDAQSRPLHGMSIAILVRSNAEADEIMAYLTDHMPQLPRLLVKDTQAAAACPLGEILLYFFKWLLHPSDNAALNITRTSFLGAIFTATTPAAQTHAHWLEKLHHLGYAATLEQLLDKLAPCDRTANEHTIRLWQISALAFDAEGSTLADWCTRMKNLSIQAAGASGAVQIMTMHKSKGLEFDAVILPYPSVQALDDTKKLAYFVSEDGSSMLLSPGSKNDWPQLSPVFPQLAAQWQQKQRKEAYNLLYVAATRARHANYIICHGAKLCNCKAEQSEPENISDWNASARSMAGLIRQAATRMAPQKSSPLGEIKEDQVIYTQGNPNWFDELSKEKEVSPVSSCTTAPLAPAAPRRECTNPSKLTKTKQPQQPEELRNAPRIDYGELTAAEFGTAVHAAWEEIIWHGTTPPPSWMAQDAPRTLPQSVVYNALLQPEIADLFTRRPGQEVYNEQGIEAITKNNEWLSGTIDRLVLTHDTSGNVTAAHIIDFKTNRLDPSKEESYEALKKEYKLQMTAYREHVAATLGIPESAVAVSLLSCPLGITAKILPYGNHDFTQRDMLE